MKKVTRRNVMASGLGLTMAGFMSNFDQAEAAGENKTQDQCWKYVKIDPQAAGQSAYDNFGTNGCLYSAFIGGLAAYAKVSDAKSAAAVKAMPTAAFRAGKGGFARLKQLCGAVAGSIMFMSCFVEDFKELTVMAEKLGKFAAETELPIFLPAEDKYPNFLKVKAGGLTCKEMGSAWMKVANAEQKKIVGERCKRHAASILAKAVELLNEKFAK